MPLRGPPGGMLRFIWAATNPGALEKAYRPLGFLTCGFDETTSSTLIMAESLPILYVKAGCPYCEDAVEFLDEHGVNYTQKEVRSDARAFEEMQKKSGQTKAPTLDWNGKILADFGVEDLPKFLRAQNVKLEDS